MIAVRKQHRAFGRGTLDLPLSAQPQDPRLCPRARGRAHPLRRQPVAPGAGGRARPRRACRGAVPIELTGGSAFPPIGDLPYLLTLPAYGFFWFLLADEAEAPRWHAPAPDAAARIRHAHRARRQHRPRARRRRERRPARARRAAAVHGRASAGSPARTRAIGKVAVTPLASSPGEREPARHRRRRHRRRRGAALPPAALGALGRGEPALRRAEALLHARQDPPRAEARRAHRRRL